MIMATLAELGWNSAANAGQPPGLLGGHANYR